MQVIDKLKRIYKVFEVTQDIKIILENTFNEIWVEGEISGISRIATGTTFFSLKDEKSILKCVIFASLGNAFKFELKDGMQVVCFGRISVYEKRGDYQLYIQKIEPKGIGSLQIALEQLKERLEKEGLFSAERKRPIPYLPSRIGVVTSLQGAAIKDILKVLDRRFKDVHIIINPARVQGEGAGQEIAQAIQDFDRFNENSPKDKKVEVLIVGRGGGSIEDLWAFNEEIVARAIYSCRIPVISAVGHERDWTIADLVSDFRAPTPSAAAEIVIPQKEDLRKKVNDLKDDVGRSFLDMALTLHQALDDLVYRLSLSIQHTQELNMSHFNAVSKKLALLNPAVLIQQNCLKIKDTAKQIYVRIGHYLKLKESRLNLAAGKLASLSPLNILARGYSIAFRICDGAVIKDSQMLEEGEPIKTRLCKGEVVSQVISKSE